MSRASSNSSIRNQKVLLARSSEPMSLISDASQANAGNAFVACSIGALVAFAMAMVFVQFCYIEIGVATLLAALVVSFAVALAVAKARGSKRGEVICLAAIVVVALALIAIFNSKTVGGVAAVAQGFNDHIYYLTGSYHLPYANVAQQYALLPLVIITALLSFIASEVASRKAVALPAILLAALFALIAFGACEFSAFAALLAVALMAQVVYAIALRDNATSATSAISKLIAVVLMLACVGGVSSLALSGKQIEMPGVSKFIKSAYLAVSGQSGYALTQGDISMQRKFKQSDRDALLLTIDSDEPQTLYIKGFVGGYYDNGVWKEANNYDVASFADSAYWLDEAGFSTQAQVATAALSAKIDGLEEVAMTIENDGARSNAYLPYSYATSDDVELSAQPSKSVVSSSKTENLSVLNMAETYSYIAQEDLANSSASDADSYLACESLYREFVYSAYTDVPESIAAVFAETLGEPMEVDCDEAKYIASTYLDSNVHYDITPDAAESGVDAIVSFLTDSRSGYSAQYASAAVMLLRYCGVPARYVEGYYVRYDGSQSGQEIQVTENDAHAWAEYYLDGVGWIPFEVTPGYVDDDFYKLSSNAQTTPDDDLQGVVEKIQQSAQTWSPSATSSPTEGESTVVPTNHRLGIWKVLLVTAIILLAIGLLAWLWARRISKRLARLRDCIYGDDLKAATLVGFSYLILLSDRGFDKRGRNVSYTIQGAEFEKAGVCGADLFEAAARSNEKAMFSAGEVAAEDREAVTDAIEACIESLSAKQGKIQRFVSKWIRGLYW